MKRTLLLFTLIFALFPVSIRRTQATASKTSALSQGCVRCGFQGDCRSCTAGGGAVYCQTFNCGACSEQGFCDDLGGGGGGVGGGGGEGGGPDANKNANANRNTDNTNKNTTKNSNKGANRNRNRNEDKSTSAGSATNIAIAAVNPLLNIDVDTIKNVARRHPRFAATLAHLNWGRLSSRFYRVHWTPVELLPKDIDALISPREKPDHLSTLNERARSLNRLILIGQLTEIVYDVTIENQTPYVRIIRIQVESNTRAPSVDPAYSSLEIRVTYADSAIGRVVREVLTTWQKDSLASFRQPNPRWPWSQNASEREILRW